VNEQGTEAAAITSVVMEIKSVVTDRFSMVFDHPFFYTICDTETGSILFMGIVCDPNKN
jgi:serpin B